MNTTTSAPAGRTMPALTCEVALNARLVGDHYPPVPNNHRTRITAVVLAITATWYLWWVARHLNGNAPIPAAAFVVATAITMLSLALTVVGTWTRSTPDPVLVPAGHEPAVAVIIPTCGEPVDLVLRTVQSVLEQDWPADQLIVIVSDDAHNPDLQRSLIGWPVHYHQPPDRWAPGRDGAAKAGNLNSAVAYLDQHHPGIRYIETRDADDELGSNQFLRHTVGQLESGADIAFVQTIKDTQTPAGDPFNNREPMFYRNLMLSKHAANAVFPCGSGVVWRREALDDIGGFPVWNLVEDLQSWVEALRRGWRGVYVPIVGAVAQHSPDDLPAVHKQRATWAMDTTRLMLFAPKSGLSVRQRLQFAMILIFYMSSFSTLIFVGCVVTSLFGASPVTDHSWRAALAIGPLTVMNEVFLLVANQRYDHPLRVRWRQYQTGWRVRVMWTGLAPVYARAVVEAVRYGPNRKPEYRVTAKTSNHRVHVRHVVPQAVMVGSMVAGVVFGVWQRTLRDPGEWLITLFFGAQYGSMLVAYVCRAWYGTSLLRAARRRPVRERTVVYGT